jgi:VWFA-related protein
MSSWCPRIFLAAVLASTGFAKAGQQPPIFRGGAVVVPIDLRVVDRLGRTVTDLKASDITLTEDGVPQELRHFSVVVLGPEPGAADVRTAFVRPSLERELTPPKRRVFLIVLGRGRLQEPAKGLDAMLRLVRERVLPQDLVAVLAYDRATAFTSDHSRIAVVLARFRARHERIEQQLRQHLSGLAGVYGSKLLPAHLRADIDDIFRPPDGPIVDRELPPAAIADEARLLSDTRRGADVALTGAPPGLDPAAWYVDAPFDTFVASTRQTLQDLGNLYTGIEYLRQLDGEKHLLFVTEHGLLLPRLDDDRGLAAIASDARVAIHPVLTGGVADYRDPLSTTAAPAAGQQARQAAVISSLKTMANLTGGHASVNTLAEAAVDRVNAATRVGYLLGYSPTNTAWRGQYRRISITVNRPDVTLLYRHGYYGRLDTAPLDRRQVVSTSRMNAAAAYRRDIRDIELRMKADALRETTPARARVEVTIAVKRLHLDDAPPDRVATFDVVLLCLDGGQRIIGQAAESVKLRLDPNSLTRALADGWIYTAHVPLPSATRAIKAVVYDYAADLLGTTTANVR